jgi:hypothetical protein
MEYSGKKWYEVERVQVAAVSKVDVEGLPEQGQEGLRGRQKQEYN